GMFGCVAWAAQSGAGRLRFRCRVAVHRLSVGPVRAPRMGSSFEQCVDIGRTHDGPVAHEVLVVVLDTVMVVEIVDHDAEGFMDRTARGVAEIGGADFSARAAERGSPCETGGAICSAS